jgi:PPE-repeat protein
MAAAAAPYVAWTRSTAAQAEQAADQAKAAATAYETAFAETVPPPVVSANRSMLMALAATNIFGQNTPAIAATETQYAEMWAQDAAAMYGYAGSSASATTLAPFTSPPSGPPSSTNADGQAGQGAAASQAAGSSAGNVQNALSSVQQALAAVPGALSNLATSAGATPAASLSPLDLLAVLSNLSGLLVDPELGAAGLGVDSTALPYDVAGALTGFHTDDIVSGWAGIQSWPGAAPVPPTQFPVITDLGSPVSAGLGEANTVGKLSVPTGWAEAAPAMRSLALPLPASSAGAAVGASAGGAGSLFGEMAVAGMAGRAMAGTGGAAAPRPRERIGAPNREPSEPPQVPAGGPITSIAAELRELASLRDSGILTDEEFTEQKRRLLAH